MKHAQAKAAMRAYFASVWNGLTKVAHDDETFEKPNGETWVRLSIRHADGFQKTAGDPGNNKHQREGAITVSVFQPQGQVGLDADEKADKAADAFIGKTYQGISFYDTTIREVGNDGAGWYQINVISRFRYDRIA